MRRTVKVRCFMADFGEEMYYILNKNIKYDPAINELSLIEEANNSLLLSNAGSRLLRELIKNRDVVISREQLLKNVWEDYGYTPSNNNLYMAVSEIRKSFISLGENKDLIVTTPKVGLRLHAEIDIFDVEGVQTSTTLVKNSEELIEETNTASPFDVDKIPAPLLHEEKFHEDVAQNDSIKKTSFYRIKLPYLALLLILLAAYIYYANSIFSIQNFNHSASFTYGSCNVYALGQGGLLDHNAIRNDVIAVLENNNISCENLKKKYLYTKKQYWI